MIQRKNVARAGVASIAALTLIFAGTTSSTAAEPDDAEIATERVAMAINAHPLANEAETLPVQAKSGALIAPGRGADVEIPTSFTDPLEVTPAGEWQSALTGLTIELPEAVQGAQPSVADDGSVVGAATDVTGVVQPIDGGLRISTIIESSDAPNSYAYTLPADVQIKLNGDGSASLSRSVEVQDENGIAAGELSAGIGEIGLPGRSTRTAKPWRHTTRFAAPI